MKSLFTNKNLNIAAYTLIVIHFLFMFGFFHPAISSMDSSGYFKQAQLIAEEGTTKLKKESPLQYKAAHWLVLNESEFISHYPPGFPFILAIFHKIGGAYLALLSIVLMCSLSLLGVYLITQKITNLAWALLAVLLLGINPVFNNYALNQDSHMATTFLLVWGSYFILQWYLTKKNIYAFVGAFFLAGIVGTRYAEVIFIIPFAVAVFVAFITKKIKWITLITFAAGAALPILAMAIYHKVVFDSIIATPYSITGESSSFSLEYFKNNWWLYIKSLLVEGLGIVLITGIAGLFAMFKQNRNIFYISLGLILPITILYMAYYFAPRMSMAILRFLVPIFPVFVISSVYLFKWGYEKWQRPAIAIILTIVIANAAWAIPGNNESLTRQRNSNGILTVISDSICQYIPEGSIIIASDPIQKQLDYLGHWNLIDETLIVGQQQRRRDRRQQPGGLMPPAPGGGGFGNAMAGQAMRAAKMEQLEYYQKHGDEEISQVFIDDLLSWQQELIKEQGNAKIYWVGAEKVVDYGVPLSDSLRWESDITIPKKYAKRMKDKGNEHRVNPGGGMPGMKSVIPTDDIMVIKEWVVQ